MAESTSEIMIKGWDQGKLLPPRVNPRISKETALVKKKDPARSKPRTTSHLERFFVGCGPRFPGVDGWDLDPERPPPSQLVTEKTAKCCTGRRATAPEQVDERLIEASDMYRNKVVREDGAHGNHTPRTQPARCPSKDEAFDRWSKSTPDACGAEDCERKEVDRSPTEAVRKASVEWLNGDIGDEKRGRQPRSRVGRFEIAGDVRVARSHHRTVERSDLFSGSVSG
ncbi:MAG: hypothetical protein Q9182_000574 [Xanthomendoza sp. 2 TL-2023]